MIGGEYKKERFSERLTMAQNQPKNRGYLPGTHLKTGGYGTGTLMGNWSEERFDAGYYDGKAVVMSGLHPPWSTTYREMVEDVAAPSSFTATTSGAHSGNCSASSRTSAPSPCDRTHFSQLTFMAIEDHTESLYPAHQPHLDPAWQETVQSTHHSTFQSSYIHPDVRRQKVKAYVPPVMGGKPSSQATGVLLRLRRQLELAQESSGDSPGASTAVTAFPGNVIRSVRQALAKTCTDPNGNVDAEELQQGFAAAGVTAVRAECVALLRYFDEEGHQTAPYMTIVNAVRGEMNSRRADLVNSVYSLLRSLSTDGVIRLDRLVEWVDVEQLPAVRSGSASPDAARAAFAAQWDARVPTAHITQTRFADFFADASFEIPLDNTFEVILRNIWHMSGGRGSCENTSCRRVEVVHTNGRVTKEEVKNDLLLKDRGDEAALESLMRENLAKQGIKDVKSIRVVSPV
ncbi:hypothetical protein CUR178_06398 [Leishmania enriettii]|uniref:EF-hand domain-containing protein n=1 Tax=Leishmania enriettii TaxID=5663 RepID=A0A836HND2_LEIEN|nr:hypothetical protein CUR178_06398 [Leishmania enriettii]